ncbi:spore coat protein [Aquibacillus halophilus]|uniref:Spore coat protein n=1 Tax=Aquibacillus halophilus TaxID=930132 RepID=A0A6A8D9L2_9BACI|nr:CotD family spore coat protein [Aquibacillus halophilus]MRH42445.1 spore coat protein [Aquibacillus halophilus]
MRHHKPYGCPKPVETVVYPTDYNVVNKCSENDVKHVHPSHTTIANHHLQKNIHVYPHSTSVANTFNSVDLYGGAYNVPAPPRPPAVPPVGPAAGVPRPPVGPYPGAPVPPAGPGVAPGVNPFYRR